MNELEVQSKTIDWLRFPLSVLVIFIHMNPIVDIQSVDYLNVNFSDLYDILGTLISKVLGQIAVPCFFIFSGYLFFIKTHVWNRTVYLTKVKTRLRSLVVPYILFNLLAIIIFALLAIGKFDGSIYLFLRNLSANWYKVFWNYSSWGLNDTNILGEITPNYGPYVLPLWFLRDLIVMVAISPIIYLWIKYTRFWGLVIFFAFYYTKIGFHIPGYSTRLFLIALFFFSIGAYYGINKKNLVFSLRKYQSFWFPTALISMLLNIYFRYTAYDIYIIPIFVLSGVISVINMTSYFIEKEKLQVRKIFSKASFFVYCIHMILILSYTHRAIKFIVQKTLGLENSIGIFAIYIITPFLCAGIILCIYMAMARFTPKFLSLFTGNR